MSAHPKGLWTAEEGGKKEEPVTMLTYLSPNASTIAMAAVQGPLVQKEIDRYTVQRFVCAHCLSPAEELCLGVPVSMRYSVDHKHQLVVRDRVAVKCLTRYMQDQSATASSNSFSEFVTDLRSAMLTEIYECREYLPTCMPLVPSRADLPPFQISATPKQREDWMLHSIQWHADHKLRLKPPDRSRVNICVEKRTICIDRHVRLNAPLITSSLCTLLPSFITRTASSMIDSSAATTTTTTTLTTNKDGDSTMSTKSTRRSTRSRPAAPNLDHFLPPVIVVPPPPPPPLPMPQQTAAAIQDTVMASSESVAPPHAPPSTIVDRHSGETRPLRTRGIEIDDDDCLS